MGYRKINENILSVGVIDWDRRLFDDLIPLPDGTSYNAYLIIGSEKTALIDTVDPEFTEVLLKNIKETGIDSIDYLIANHAEQDHSGSIPAVLEEYPDTTLLTGKKGKDMLLDLMEIDAEKIKIVGDNDTVSLGDKTLEFIDTPLVHWPETISTYLQEDKILFPCDFLGSHLATSDLFVTDEAEVYRAAKRYYAEIMMPFRKMIVRNLAKIEKYDCEIVAPSHGPIYDNPEMIINAYKDWTSDEVKPEVVIPYISMHGSTKEMIDYFIDNLTGKGIKVKPFNLTETDLGDLAMSLVDAAAVVIGSPTVLTGPHPQVVYAAYLANALRPKTKYASIIGSYGWAGNMVDDIVGMLSNLNVELFEPVVAKGKANSDDFKELDRLIADIEKVL